MFRKARILFVLLLAATWIVNAQSADQNQDNYLKQVREILKKTPLIDGHNDLPWQLREKFKNHLSSVDLNDTSKLKEPFHTDIPRLRQGMVGAQFWSVYVPSTLAGSEPLRAVLEQIDVTKRFVRAYPAAFEMAYTSADIERIHRNGKVASLIGIEGGHCITDSLAVLRQLYELGSRYMTLTHWQSTKWADAATQDPQYGGLTKFGEAVVKEMNRLGMLVDLSHVSAETMNDVVSITASPVIFSHSSCRSISGHPRNVPDEVLKRLPANGGIVMINFALSFVSEEARKYGAEKDAAEARLKDLYLGNPQGYKEAVEGWKKENPPPAVTLEQVADHFDHARKIAGIDHVGIGSDFDGISTTPVGLEDVSKYAALLAELMRRGYGASDIQKVAGLNLLRVMKKNEEIASQLQKQKPPADALIEELDPPKTESVKSD